MRDLLDLILITLLFILLLSCPLFAHAVVLDPSPSPSAAPSATPTPDATSTPSPSAEPSAAPGQSPSATPEPSPSADPSATPEPSPTGRPTETPTPTPTATPVPTAAAVLDFDGDGASEIGGIEVQNDGSSNEIVYHLQMSSDSYTKRYEFGKRDDLEVPGDYNGDGKWDLAVAQKNGQSYLWRMRPGLTGAPTEFYFGEEEDILLSGCRFDSDIKHDPALVRSTTLMFRSSVSEETVEAALTLGESASVISLSCGDLNGDGIDELIILEDVSGSKKKQILRAFSVKGEQIFSRKVRKVKAILAADINNDGTDEAGILRERRGKRTRLVFYLNDSKPTRFRMPKVREITRVLFPLGEGNRTNGVIFRKRRKAFKMNFSDTVSTPIVMNDGVSRLFKSVNAHFTGSSLKLTPDSSCTTLSSALDGPNGFLWKEAEHGGLVVLFPYSYQKVFSGVTVIKNGKVHGELYYTGKANGDRQHWRHHKNAGSFPNDSIVAAVLKGKTYCWQIGNSGQRND